MSYIAFFVEFECVCHLWDGCLVVFRRKFDTWSVVRVVSLPVFVRCPVSSRLAFDRILGRTAQATDGSMSGCVERMGVGGVEG